jgi:O-antigen ligase
MTDVQRLQWPVTRAGVPKRDNLTTRGPGGPTYSRVYCLIPLTAMSDIVLGQVTANPLYLVVPVVALVVLVAGLHLLTLPGGESGGPLELTRAVVVSLSLLLFVPLTHMMLDRQGPAATVAVLRWVVGGASVFSGVLLRNRALRVLDFSIIILAVRGLSLIRQRLAEPQAWHRAAEGHLGGPNVLAAFVSLMLLARFSGWIIGGLPKPSYLVIGASGVNLVLLLLTQTRGAWIGFAAGLAVLAAHGRSKKRRRWFVIIGVLAIVAILASASLRTRIASISISNSSGRNLIWQQAYDKFVENPVLGNGFGTFRAYSPYLVEVRLQEGNMTESAHNQILQILAELGLLGLVARLAMLWYAWRRFNMSSLAPAWLAFGVSELFATSSGAVQWSWLFGLLIAVQATCIAPAEAEIGRGGHSTGKAVGARSAGEVDK